MELIIIFLVAWNISLVILMRVLKSSTETKESLRELIIKSSVLNKIAEKYMYGDLGKPRDPRLDDLAKTLGYEYINIPETCVWVKTEKSE